MNTEKYLNADEIINLVDEGSELFKRLEDHAKTLYSKDADIMVYCSIENICESTEGAMITESGLFDILKENISICHSLEMYV